MPRTKAVKEVTAYSPNGSNGTKPKVFDLSQRFARAAVEVVIYDPAEPGEKVDTGIRIGIKSAYSKEARDAATAARSKIVLDDNGNVVSTPAENLDSIAEQTIGATVYWFHADLSKPRRPDGTWEREEGFEDVLLVGSERIPCTPDTVRKLYTDERSAWIARPVQLAFVNVAGFFGPPKTA